MKGSRRSPSLGPLRHGGRVIIIGGGPAGVSCALALRNKAAQLGRDVNITILENKVFAGERHYNQCVGVLSPPIASLVEKELDLPFPLHLKRESIQGYILHTAREQITLDETGEPSLALRRILFDAYMLESAKQCGINVLQTRAVELEFFEDHVVVYTDSKLVEGDVVVGAWGTDYGCASFFNRMTGYRPPKTLHAIVTKYHPGDDGMADFGSYIHAFLPRHPRIEFGAVTPKGNHLNINIAGKTVNSHLMNEFLAMPKVRKILPNFELAGTRDPEDLQFFKGQFPCSLARKYFGDRYVIIGDAAGLLRPFKGKGVTSAVLTGIRAAETILLHGISEASFLDHFQAANQDIIHDSPYGNLMRSMTILMARLRLLDPVIRVARRNTYLREALFDAVSAHDSYQHVLMKVFKPQSFIAILVEMLRSLSGETGYTNNLEEISITNKIIK